MILYLQLYVLIGILLAVFHEHLRKEQISNRWFLQWIGFWPVFLICMIVFAIYEYFKPDNDDYEGMT